jgi:hypothetical protein
MSSSPHAITTRRSLFPRAVALAMAMSLVGLIASGCGSSTKSTSTKAAASPPAATSTTTTATTSSSGLSGKWSGQYSGAYSGTFKLNWQQSGSTLKGTISLSAPPGTLGINGTVSGSSIKFGTVGGPGITYTGSVSGNSMSGSYTTPNGGGSWSATKSS